MRHTEGRVEELCEARWQVRKTQPRPPPPLNSPLLHSGNLQKETYDRRELVNINGIWLSFLMVTFVLSEVTATT